MAKRPLEGHRQGIRIYEGQVRRPHRRRFQGRGDRIVEDDRDPRLRSRRRDRSTLLRDPYYIVPAKGGEKAYALLREAIKNTGTVGIGKITMRTNSLHLAGVKSIGEALVLEIMRFGDELVDRASSAFPTDAGVRPQELQMAEQLVGNLSTSFDPANTPTTIARIS
jgi:hypothetical protein